MFRILLILCICLRPHNRSLDINDTSDTASESEFPFEQDVCMDDSQDFKDDQGCNLSPNLLRMVEQDEKQILPHKESIEIVSLGEGQEVKIGTCINTKMK